MIANAAGVSRWSFGIPARTAKNILVIVRIVETFTNAPGRRNRNWRRHHHRPLPNPHHLPITLNADFNGLNPKCAGCSSGWTRLGTKAQAVPGNTTLQVSGPMHRAYWTRERLEQIKQLVEETVVDFESWQVTAYHGEYRGVTLTLVRKLKGLPEWEGLSPEEAARALDVAFQMLGKDWDSMIPVCGVNQLEARDDFIATWKGVRLALDPEGRDPLVAAYEFVCVRPQPVTADIREWLGSCTPKFWMFFCTAHRLQQMMGPCGYILLPQEKIARLMKVSQWQVSAWCTRLRQLDVLEEVERFIPGKKATRWRFNYTVTFSDANL
ncbi:MAG: hypothetical protein DMG97_10800 [Acidobacteria bacterium]|nr:MAG: hypothetical protein DMG97_10800 [Acidobacteriota bacterium]